MKLCAIGLPVVAVVAILWIDFPVCGQVQSPTPTSTPTRAQLRVCGDDPGEAASIASVVVAAAGQCPCGGFGNHAAYVKCVRSAAKAAVKNRVLTQACFRTAVRDATLSTCSRRVGAVTCCRVNAKGKKSCGVSSSAARCVPQQGGSATIGNSESCYGACLPSPAEVTHTDAQVQAAVGTALEGVADPWGELGLVQARAFAELGVRLDLPQPTPASQTLQGSRQVSSQTTTDCLHVYCDGLEGRPLAYYCGGASNSVTAPGFLGVDVLGAYGAAGPCLNYACYLHDLRSFKSCIYGTRDALGKPIPGNPGCEFSPQSAAPSADGSTQNIDGALFDACGTCPDLFHDGGFPVPLGPTYVDMDIAVCSVALALEARPWCSDAPWCLINPFGACCKDERCRTSPCPSESCDPLTSKCLSPCANNGCATFGATQCLNSTTEQTCVDNGTGCLSWGSDFQCADGCVGTACATCVNECSAGQTQCLDSTTQQTCGVDSLGCLTWGSNYQCADGCVGNACALPPSATPSATPTPTAPATAIPVAPWPMFGHDAQHTGASTFLGPQTNNLRWAFAVGAAVQGSPVVGANGTVYFTSNDGYLYAVNPDGTSWRTFAGDSVDSGGLLLKAPAIGGDGTVYLAAGAPALQAFTPDGNVKWVTPPTLTYPESPIIDGSGAVYFTRGGSGNNGCLEAVRDDGTTGTLLWQSCNGLWGSPSINPDGSRLYVPSGNGQVVSVDSTSGTVLSVWGGSKLSVVVDNAGTTYFGSSACDSILCGGSYEAIRPDGTWVWSENAMVAWFAWADRAVSALAGGRVYFVNGNSLTAARTSDGVPVWSFPLSDSGGPGINEGRASPAVDVQGSVYIGSSIGIVYAINPDGTEKWHYQTGGAINTQPAIGADGTMYVGSEDGNLYAFGQGTGLVPTPTPTPPTILDQTSPYPCGGVGYTIGDPSQETEVAQLFQPSTSTNLGSIEIGLAASATKPSDGVKMTVYKYSGTPSAPLGDEVAEANADDLSAVDYYAVPPHVWPVTFTFSPTPILSSQVYIFDLTRTGTPSSTVWYGVARGNISSCTNSSGGSFVLYGSWTDYSGAYTVGYVVRGPAAPVAASAVLGGP